MRTGEKGERGGGQSETREMVSGRKRADVIDEECKVEVGMRGRETEKTDEYSTVYCSVVYNVCNSTSRLA